MLLVLTAAFTDVAKPENDLRDCRRWENMISLSAQLTGLNGGIDFSGYGFTALFSAFGPYDASWPAPVNDRPVRAANLWLVHAADKYWSITKDSSSSVSHEDWTRWKGGLEDSKKKYATEDTQKLISEALAKMSQVEAEA